MPNFAGNIRKPLAERFWSKVKKTKTCWLWIGGSVNNKGYGYILTESKPENMSPDEWRERRNKRKRTLAHILSWTFQYGSPPDGLCVLHKCDVPLCVRPSHLFLGTKKQNSQDMAYKGRSTRGSKSKNAQLTEKQVLLIRKRYLSGKWTQRALGELYGVAPRNISRIVLRQRWTHI
jgi:hypothetical protein